MEVNKQVHVRSRKKRIFLLVFAIMVVLIISTSLYGYFKKSPDGLAVNGEFHTFDEVEFLNDMTYKKESVSVHEQEIFSKSLEIIEEAKELIILDLFLYNDDYDRTGETKFINAAEQLTDALIKKKEANNNLEVVILTDEINTFYYSYQSQFLERLKKAGITVVITKMEEVRDSNPVYSGLWRSSLQFFGTSENGWITNAFSKDSPDVTIRSYMRLINFKANHRKILLTEKEALITSANIGHDGSSLHSNIAFVVKGPILQEIYDSEKAVAEFSGVSLENREFSKTKESGEGKLKLLTESAIEEEMLYYIENTKAGDKIELGVFYLSDRDIVKELIRAAKREVTVHIILDPNKDAFGREKGGIPNRQVASELMKKGGKHLEVRWYDTNGEQFHSKFIMIQNTKETIIIGGSANFTKRNIAGFNLETNVLFAVPNDHTLAGEMNSYFQKMWLNEEGQFTTDYEKYKDEALWKKWLYRFQEWSGLSTF